MTERTTTYWHGGRPGIQRGAYLLPPSVTKVPSCSEFGAAGVHRRDRVYVTTHKVAALLYAAGQRKGVIYECEPIGALEPDPDCHAPGLSWQCEKARVIRCVKPKAVDIEMARAVLLHQASCNHEQSRMAEGEGVEPSRAYPASTLFKSVAVSVKKD